MTFKGDDEIEKKTKYKVGQTAYLKNPENRKKYKGNNSPSYMELSFRNWLLNNNFKENIHGFLTEIHFYNKLYKKHGWIDFLFPKLKLIIELDGNHHRYRKELDTIRDNYLLSKGYTVIRITHTEYTKRTRMNEICKLLGVVPYSRDSNPEPTD